MPIKSQLLLIEMNEVNFEYIDYYVKIGQLPAFKDFIERHSYGETTSEQHYDKLEPWIQWVTAHTGLAYADHGVFRLGDITQHDIPQIWEELEAAGLKVGAISPMNAKYRLKSPAFFVPDPWTSTELWAAPIVKRLYRAIAQAVNDNAKSRLNLRSAIDLMIGGIAAAHPRNYGRYASYIANARTRPWSRALFLDLLLADLFRQSTRKTKPDFASIFLNAAAHIQHHYMFSSAAYDGEYANPDWYVPRGADPLLDVYRLYDNILADIRSDFPDARIMLATGLHQDPHTGATYYWRLRDHAAFLQKIGIEFAAVEPRMSRDFLIKFEDSAAAVAGARRLESAIAVDGTPLFDIDNRGSDLFVMLTYDKDITREMSFSLGNESFSGLKSDVAFVAIKNGQHNGIGYFSDSGVAEAPSFALADLPSRIRAALA